VCKLCKQILSLHTGVSFSFCLESLPTCLQVILKEELKAGNEIDEISKGDWPDKNSILIFLKKPFLTPIRQNLPYVEYRLINDPHYWKAEYHHQTSKILLCCLMVLLKKSYSRFGAEAIRDTYLKHKLKDALGMRGILSETVRKPKFTKRGTRPLCRTKCIERLKAYQKLYFEFKASFRFIR